MSKLLIIMSKDRFKPTEIDRLHPEDNIRVEITNVNGDTVAGYKGSGFSNISDAIDSAYDTNSELLGSKDDYVYTVTDMAKNISHRYRINAGCHVKLLV